ncbi:MAG: serine/threonine-protein phosphatase [Ignavibacteriae bacterium]|nr:serine/threonine-protein phosphatase [Ignavibacteriota bacterium]
MTVNTALRTLLESVCLSETGPTRLSNEDSLVVVDYAEQGQPEKGVLLVVSDGMGGHNAGEIASTMVTSLLPDFYRSSSVINCAEALVQSVIAVNEQVYDRSMSDRTLRGMGATVVAAVVVNGCVAVVNVGDSRAYLLHNDILRQVSHDDTLRQNHFGIFPPKFGEELSHVLTQAIGPHMMVSPHVSISKVTEGDMLLLSSDGLTSVVTDEEIRYILTNKPLEETSKALFDMAIAREGDDNISVIISSIN